MTAKAELSHVPALNQENFKMDVTTPCKDTDASILVSILATDLNTLILATQLMLSDPTAALLLRSSGSCRKEHVTRMSLSVTACLLRFIFCSKRVVRYVAKVRNIQQTPSSTMFSTELDQEHVQCL
jgi:hypothetical protein